MSELQLALLILGALVILGVIVYNRIQESRFRERAESAFAAAKGDVTAATPEPVRAPVQDRERIEPQFQDSPPHVGGNERHEPAAPGAQYDDEPMVVRAAAEATGNAQRPARKDVPALELPTPAAGLPSAQATQFGERREPEVAPLASEDDPLCYCAHIEAPDPVTGTAIDNLRRGLGDLEERTRIEAWQVGVQRWITAGVEPSRKLRVWLQLVDRRGMVSQQELAAFQAAVMRCASSAGGSATMPQAEPYLARAKVLDEFCADVDVVVGINVRAPNGRGFIGTRVRGVLEASGFTADEERYGYRDANGLTRFVVENQDQSALTPEALRTSGVSGLTLLFDVPRQPDGVTCFNQMVAVGRQLAQALGGTLVDDNGTPVTEAGLEQIRAQLRAIYGNMEARGMPPGSPMAQRLFG